MPEHNFAVIFDMDGVIVDTNPFHKKALIAFCKAHGYDLTEAQLIEKIYGRTNKDWIPNLFSEPLTICLTFYYKVTVFVFTAHVR